jgi:small subunit ribosomal protein S15
MSKIVNAAKPAVVSKHQIHSQDTGSCETQIAVLSSEIQNRVKHLQKNPKDHTARKAILRSVNQRRRTLKYLASISQTRARKVVTAHSMKGL